MNAEDLLPVGKLPPSILAQLLSQAPVTDPRVVLGPGLGLDCAVLDFGADLLVLKTDPITFASDEIGWYLVQINANDIATSGATPRWLLVTLLLPEGQATPASVIQIGQQLAQACLSLGISIIGGHTEVTYGLDRPLAIGTMLGEVGRQALVTPKGARPGDSLLLTKGVPIEATALLARDLPERLQPALTPAELAEARDFLYRPGISVVQDARLALAAGEVHAMHDPTEGGLVGALWELADACQHTLHFDPSAVPVPQLSARICQALEIDPLAAIASGALLLAAAPASARPICEALEAAGIFCAEIGQVVPGPATVLQAGSHGLTPLPRPARDEIARLFEKLG